MSNEIINRIQQQRQMKNYLKVGLIATCITVLSLYAWNSTQETKPLQQRLLVTTFQTSTTRTENVGKFCAGLSRASLVNSEELSTAATNMKNVEAEMGVDGNKLILSLTKGNLSDVVSMLNGNIRLYIFVGIFLLGFIIFLFTWPFLCCCCCCPSCCPSKCCQKSQDQPYSKCELYWPTFVLICALLLTISASVYGFVHTTNVKGSFTSLQCSVAIFTDDILNGNVTTSGTEFFAGLTKLSSSISDISGNLTFLQGNMSELGGTTGTIGSTTQASITTLTGIRDTQVVAIMGGFNPLYSIPVAATSPAGTFTSTFKAEIGPHNTAGTHTQQLFAAFTEVIVNLTAIKTLASNFATATSGGSVSTSSLNTMKTSVDQLVTNLNDMDKLMKTFLTFLSTPADYGNVGLQGFYGFLILFSFFALLGALLTACCNKYSCRHLMYFSCIFIFIGTLITFLIAFLFSIMVPIFTWSCSYLNTTLDSDTNFRTNFESFLDTSTLSKITSCMPFGDGKLITNVGGTAADGLNNLTSVLSNIFTFNETYLLSVITSKMITLQTAANQYANGHRSDLDAINNAELVGLSNPSNVTNSVNCGVNLALDSWVPSNSQITSDSKFISCKVSTGKVGDTTTCNSAAFTNVSPTLLCQGCMDTTKVLSAFTSQANVQSAAVTKYGGNSLCVFAKSLGNVWTNYYSIKKTHYNALNTRVLTAANKIEKTTTGTNQTKTALTDFKTQLTNLDTAMAAMNSITDPQYGVLAGMNCKIFGEDFVRLKNVMCGGFYNNIYGIRLVFGIAAFGMLFSMCCIVCTGVRHFKKGQRQGRVLDINLQPKKDESVAALNKEYRNNGIR